MKITTTFLAVGAIALFAGAANAATISFSLDDKRGFADYPIDVTLTEFDGGVTFDYSSPVEGDSIAVYFNTDASILEDDISALIPDDTFVTGFGTNTSDVQGGNIGETFDYGLAIGTTGAGKDFYQVFSFAISGVDLGDFTNQLFAVRAQSICNGLYTLTESRSDDCGGSAKNFGNSGDGGTTVVPLPAAGWLLLGGLGGLAAVRRRKTA